MQRLGILATRASETNLALAQASLAFGVPAVVMTPEQALTGLRPGDLALGRLDVLPTLDGVEDGLWQLRLLERKGVRVLNRAGTLVAAHDKLATARHLDDAGVPHPETTHLLPGATPALDAPAVVKPRFGSWGRDVERCDDGEALAATVARIGRRAWFAAGGAIVQRLVQPRGYDLRVVVAGGVPVGAVRRVAPAGEWRTNVALDAVREPATPPPAAAALAVAAAASVGGDLVGVDLVPLELGWTVLEVNGAVDFTHAYSARGDVHEAAMGALLDAARRSPVPHAESVVR